MLITSGRLRVKFAKVWICFNWRNLEMIISCITVFFPWCFSLLFLFSGVEILNKAISKLTSKGGGVSGWRTILIEISVSNIRITDCTVSCSLSIFSPKIM